MKLFLTVLLTIGTLAAQDAEASLQAGLAKIKQVAELVQQGNLGPTYELIHQAIDDMDRAVSMAPDNINIRARRGLMYIGMTTIPGIAEVSAEDLGIVSADPRFGELSEVLRQAVQKQVGILHPDRFPRVAADTSPILAAISSTTSQPWADGAVRGLDGTPGFLGKHVLNSVDHPGMVILFTWWKDKQALNSFFNSDRGMSLLQMTVEVFAGLPSGSQTNAGFIPQTVFDMFKNTK